MIVLSNVTPVNSMFFLSSSTVESWDPCVPPGRAVGSQRGAQASALLDPLHCPPCHRDASAGGWGGTGTHTPPQQRAGLRWPRPADGAGTAAGRGQWCPWEPGMCRPPATEQGRAGAAQLPGRALLLGTRSAGLGGHSTASETTPREGCHQSRGSG